MNLGCHIRNKAEHYKNAETKARSDENYGSSHPHHLCPCWIVGLRATEVQWQLSHQCHQGQIDLQFPGIHTTAGNATGSLEAI